MNSIQVKIVIDGVEGTFSKLKRKKWIKIPFEANFGRRIALG